MKAMILAAGLGTRLGNITKQTPKCLVDVAGRSMLERVLFKLSDAGVDEFVINTFYLADVVSDCLERNRNFGLKIHLSREEELLGTGGGIGKARDLLQGADCFIVHNSDVFSDINISELVAAHRRQQAGATLAVMDVPTSRPLLFDIHGHLAGWENTESGAGTSFGQEPHLVPLHFSGIQVVSTELLSYFSKPPPYSSISCYIDAARDGKAICSYIMPRDIYWIDMGTPQALAELRSLLAPAVGMQ